MSNRRKAGGEEQQDTKRLSFNFYRLNVFYKAG